MFYFRKFNGLLRVTTDRPLSSIVQSMVMDTHMQHSLAFVVASFVSPLADVPNQQSTREFTFPSKPLPALGDRLQTLLAMHRILATAVRF